MLKLLNKYRANPTFTNASALRAYDYAHPFAMCMLSREDGEEVSNAIIHANLGFICDKAEGDNPWVPSNARTAQVLNESGIFKPFTVIGIDDDYDDHCSKL